MTNRLTTAYSDDLMARGRMLAEGRMAFLTELYDSGRWKRYHEEQAFLKMVRESRAALDKWMELAPPSHSLPTASMLPTPTMFARIESSIEVEIADPLDDALAAISLEMGLSQDEAAGWPAD